MPLKDVLGLEPASSVIQNRGEGDVGGGVYVGHPSEEVGTYDVVVTNPPHSAIALEYDANTMTAPRVTAKGGRLIAEQIKAVARQHGVPIVENRPQAQTLYRDSQAQRSVRYP